MPTETRLSNRNKIPKKLAKGSSCAFVGIPLLLCLLLILSGCAWFEDNRVAVKPKWDTTSPEFMKMVSNIVNQRYKPEILKWIEADLSYQEYLLNGQGKSIRKDDYALERRH